MRNEANGPAEANEGDRSLHGRTVLVTGGGTGIGWGVAQAFARRGGSVMIAGRREQTLRDAAQSWHGNPAIETGLVDVSDRQKVQQLVDTSLRRFGHLDVLVHAAGVNVPNRSMAAMTPRDWDHILAVNATGAYNMLHAVLPSMRDQGRGLIVIISSIAGKRASDLGGIAYCASKFAATGLGTAVGLEEARHGIRVTNIYPGEVNTPLLDARPVPVPDADKDRMLQPRDLGDMVVALAALPDHVHVPELVIKPLSQAYA